MLSDLIKNITDDDISALPSFLEGYIAIHMLNLCDICNNGTLNNFYSSRYNFRWWVEVHLTQHGFDFLTGFERTKRRQKYKQQTKGNAVLLMFVTNITKRGNKENIATIMPPKVKVDSHH